MTVGLALLLPGLASSQISPATLPDLKLAVAGNVRSMIRQDDGKLIVCGDFSAVNDVPRDNLARLNSNGSVDLAWNPGIYIEVRYGPRAVCVHGSETFVASAPSPVVKLAADGSLNTNWNPVVSGFVEAVVVSGSNIFIGGDFTDVSGSGIRRLARMSTEGNGTVDTNWNPALDGPVHGLAIAGTNLFVVGGFTNIGNLSHPGVAKLSLATGAPDPAWNPGIQAGANLRTLVVVGTNLYVAGDFVSNGGTLVPGVAKLAVESTGAIDSNWQPSLPGGATINALTVANNAVYLGGASNGCAFLVKVAADGVGALDPGWNETVNLGNSANQNSAVQSLLATATALYVGGSFVKIGSSPAVTLGLGKVDPVSGFRDGGFISQVQFAGQGYALARQDDGRVILGGWFQVAGGLARRNLVRISVNGQVDPTWAPETDYAVRALALSGTDLFAAGDFTQAGALNRRFLAKFATLAGDAVDAAWDAGLTNNPAYPPRLTLAANSTNLFVGGQFLGLIGGQLRYGLARLSTTGNGAADPAWLADISNGGAWSLALVGTNLFVGGSFTNLNGSARAGIAKISALGAGLLDTNWNPLFVSTNGQGVSIFKLAVSDTNLYAAGEFNLVNSQFRNGLAKLITTGAGQLDPLWSPNPNNRPDLLALSGTDLYVAGFFSTINGQAVPGLARISTLGTGAVDTVSAPNPSGTCTDLLVRGNDLYVAGMFENFAKVPRNGFALQPVAGAPVLIQDSPTNLFIFRHPLDGPEVTHFQILSSGGAPLYLSDGTNLVKEGDFITVAQGGAGLIFAPNGVLTVAAAVSPEPEGVGSAASTLIMGATAPPVFAFTSPDYSVREGQGNIVVTVRKFGSGAASVNYVTADQTATGGLDYQSRTGTLAFSSADKFKNVIIAIADDLQTEGDEQFAVTLSLPQNANGVIADPASAAVTIVDNDIVGLSDSFPSSAPPSARPAPTGALQVTLQPSAANGQWRLAGELQWHNSGDVITGLTADNYQVEFRPVTAYVAPDTRYLPMAAGVTNQFPAFEYYPAESAATGNLTVHLWPPEVATNGTAVLRGQWKRLEETTANWRDGDAVITNLPAGDYTVEFKPVDGRITPAPHSVSVGTAATYGISATYLLAPAAGAPTNLFVVPPEIAATNRPYCFIGQIQSSAGFGSGFVVKPRVVLTAAHVLFDDVMLANVTEVRWFFQWYRDRFEPVPQTPRGWYVFEGYAAQRQADNSPGISSPESQQRDVAAMYFLESAGRGGYGGYLSSDADANEYLLNAADKFLAGYPLDGIATADQGKLHASTPTNLVFTHLYGPVFATSNLLSYPGNSGGPLYVQTDVETFYPAAIYLGGSGQTLVRAINSEAVDLINRAEISANGGGNSTGGGVTIISVGTTTAPAGQGTVTVRLSPTNAVNKRPGWRVRGSLSSSYFTTPVRTQSFYAYDTPVLQFQSVPGFRTPAEYPVGTIVAGQNISLLAEYVPIRPLVAYSRDSGLRLIGNTGATYRVEFTTNPAAPGSWTSLTNLTLTPANVSANTLSNASVTLANTLPAAAGNRFYRASLVP